MALQHLRSSTADKRPTPAAMSDGQLAMNTNLVSPGLFFKDSNGDSVKIGPVHVGTTAPNATPGAGGQAGNSKGEQWLDTSSSRYVFKIWDGTAWRTEDGEFVNTSGDLMTGALGIIAGTDAAPGLYFSGDTNTGIYSPGLDTLAFAEGGSERVRLDSSGKLLVGTSTNLQTPLSSSTLAGSNYQQRSIDQGGASAFWSAYSATSTIAPNLLLGRSRGAIDAQGLVSNNDSLGRVVFLGSDGQAVGTNAGFVRAAVIEAQVDGVAAAGDMPGRLVFSTTNGASTPTERMRIDNDGVIAYDQPTPATYAAAATLTVADLKTGIITYTGTAATLTLPTGTLTEGGFNGIYTNMAFEWSVINTGAGICTIGAGTAHTIVGSGTVAIGASARFASRRTAANTFVSYRLS